MWEIINVSDGIVQTVLECVDTKPKTHLFGRILRILRRENLLGDSPPAFPLLVCAEILLKNLHIILVSTHPKLSALNCIYSARDSIENNSAVLDA